MSDQVVAEAPTTSAPQQGAAPSTGGLAVQPGGGQPAQLGMQGVILPPKKKRRRIVLPLVLMAAVGGGGYEGYRWFVEGRFLVSTDDAYVKADMSIIAAKVGGYVAAVPVVENTHVHKGDILASIDDGDYKIAVDSAKTRIDTQDATIARFDQQIQAQNAMVAQAQAQVASAKAEAVRTATEYDRAKSLMQSSYGTQQRLDQALADRDRAAAAVASAAASLTSAQAAIGVLGAQKLEAQRTRAELGTVLARAERDLSFTTIKAPFDGVVGNKAVQPGQYVQTGTRLLALVPLDSAYIEANFKETQIDRLKPGQKVSIRPDAYSSREIEGSVESVAPASGAEFSMLPPENATGNFTKIVQRIPVRIKIPTQVADEGILRPGLSVEVSVHTRDENTPPPSLVSALGLGALASAVHSRTTQQD
jgi:membrane fusion protein (multidrug efflux system)